LEQEPARLSELGPALEELAEKLGAEFVAHMENEERNIFPAVRAVLSLAEQDQIAKELRGRRAASAE
jgi:hypothetical protein